MNGIHAGTQRRQIVLIDMPVEVLASSVDTGEHVLRRHKARHLAKTEIETTMKGTCHL